jgi:cytidylate kinase
MAIVTISRGCFSHGKEIAEKVAETLGYECISREILIEASRFFQVPEMKLLKSIHDAPNILERITRGRKRYLAYIQAALLEHVKKDNVVYHGHAGHLLLPEISHLLKVRVIAGMEERVTFLQQKQDILEKEAIDFIQSEDKHRINWTRYLYKMEVSDPGLYDILINIGQVTIHDACNLICTAVHSDTYKTTFESQRIIENLALASHVQTLLQDVCDAHVTVDDGVATISVQARKLKKTSFSRPEVQQHVRETIRDDLVRDIVQISKKVPGVKEVICDVDLPYYA